MAKKPPPPSSPSASSLEEEEASSDEEQQPATSKPESQTPVKDDEEDEDDESEVESEEESDEDDEEPGSDSKKPQPSAATPAPAPAPALALALAPSKPASESESGSESEDDSDSEEAKLVTPISSRPMADDPVLKASDSEKPNGKPLFQRIWTPDDEIAILNAMVDFEPERGPIKLNPSTIGGFLGFVKDSLSIGGVSGSQLVDKIRRLKKKYSVVAARAMNNGKGLKFATAHDQAVYELAKKVWGKEEGDDDRETVANGKSNVVAIAGGKRGYPLLTEAVAEIEKKMGNSLVAEALETIDSEKASVFEKKLKKQKMAELKHIMHKLDLLKETLKLILEGDEKRAMN